MTNLFDSTDLIFSYTREQAIADGVLVDVSEWAKEVGIAAHTVFTQALWADCEESAVLPLEPVERRAHDILWLALLAVVRVIMRGEEHTIEPFSGESGGRQYDLWLAFNPAEGFTIGYPSDF